MKPTKKIFSTRGGG